MHFHPSKYLITLGFIHNYVEQNYIIQLDQSNEISIRNVNTKLTISIDSLT